MFLFDWRKIYKEANGSAVEIVRIVRMLVHRQIPTNAKDPIYKYSQKNFLGDSFMLHPDVLLYHSHKYQYRELAQYIALCSFRSTAYYRLTKDTTLDTVLLPTEDTEILIQNNRLLYIEGDILHFMYEEVNTKEIH
ncbi:MAG: hypothetical protein CL973_00945 [Euryarchaeota archaeon]|nr:hypothetical protein [Euryarchaeota archaeon]|tara:strand:- start:3229 stop:3636 length:408 start_codon:yes stop_codon:yes gene_type:complete